MENVHDTTSNKLVKSLSADQHSLALTLVLHLLPGAIVLVAYFVLAAPLVQAIGYPPFLAWVIALFLVLVPTELGLLFYLGWKKNGELSLRGIVAYLERPLKRSVLIGLIIALIIVVYLASVLLAPVDAFVYSQLFSWIPFQSVGGGGGYLTGYARSTVIVTIVASLIFTGVIGPAIEELYFRGYLLPRLSRLGRWAPILNMVLFSLYHFWTPWQFVSRVGFFLPTVWMTWSKKDLRISLWVHCLANTMVQLVTLIAILFMPQ